MRSVDNTEHKQAGNLRGMELKTFIADICQLILPTLCPSSEVPDASLRLKSTHMYALAEYGQIELIHGMMRRNLVISLQKTYSWGIKTVVKKIQLVTISNNSTKHKKIVLKIIHSAKSEFYLTEIISATSKKRLFTAFKKTIRSLKCICFYKYMSNGPAFCYFIDFIINNVNAIRTNIDQKRQPTLNSTAISQTSPTICDSLNPVTAIQLHVIIKNSTFYILRIGALTNFISA